MVSLSLELGPWSISTPVCCLGLHPVAVIPSLSGLRPQHLWCGSTLPRPIPCSALILTGRLGTSCQGHLQPWEVPYRFQAQSCWPDFKALG